MQDLTPMFCDPNVLQCFVFCNAPRPRRGLEEKPDAQTTFSARYSGRLKRPAPVSVGRSGLDIPAGVVAQIMGHKPSAHCRETRHERIEAWMLQQAKVRPRWTSCVSQLSPKANGLIRLKIQAAFLQLPQSPLSLLRRPLPISTPRLF